MNIKKQEIGVWVKASEELPDRDNGYVVEMFSGTIHRKLWSQLDRERSINIWEKQKVIRWLKPIKDVYVLTETDLQRLMSKYANHCTSSVYNDNTLLEPNEFIESITKQQ